jgi:hypothetical protein
LASSEPAMSSQPIDGEASGLISTGLVFGMCRISLNTATTSRAMNTIGSQCSMNVCTSGSHRKVAEIMGLSCSSARGRGYSTLCSLGLDE